LYRCAWNSTCCNNTASEHLMMERLIVDDLVHWAKDYKVDGFRFDLMGHLMLRTVERARDALGSLTLESDGVGPLYNLHPVDP
jgi:pullulanase